MSSTFLTENYAEYLGRIVSQASGPSLAVQKIIFSPFGEIKIQNVRFRDSSGASIVVDSVAFRYIFHELLNKRLVLKNIRVSEASVDISHQKSKTLLEDAVSFLGQMHFPTKEGPLKVILQETEICFKNARINFLKTQEPANKDFVALDFCLNIHSSGTLCSGSMNYKNSPLINKFLEKSAWESLMKHNKFSFDVGMMGPDIILNDAKLSLGPYSLSTSGVIHNYSKEPIVDFKVYSSAIRLEDMPQLKIFKPRGGDISMLGHLTGSLSNLNLQAELMMPIFELTLEDYDLALERFTGQLSYSFKEGMLNIRDFKGEVDNNLSIVLKGTIKNFLDPFWNIHAIISPKYFMNQKLDVPINPIVKLRGKFNPQDFDGLANLIIYDAIKKKQYVLTFNRFSFKNEAMQKNRKAIRIDIPKSRLTENLIIDKGLEEFQSFDFDTISLLLGRVGRRTQFHKIALSAYGGQATLKGYIQFDRNKTDYAINAELNHLHLNEIKLSYPLYSEFSGIFSGLLSANNKQGPVVKGQITADGFRLRNLEPVNKIADFLGLNSIKEINDALLAVDFELTPRNSLIQRFDLDSPDLSMRSSFEINLEQWMEGNVAMSLPRNFLLESKIFKILLAMAHERENRLDFVVHLSGFVKALRSELIKSDFRDKLKERVGTRTKQRIENELDKAIKASTP